jgi:hypothetical protein
VPDQPDQRRAAIQAVRDLLSSRTVRGLALDGITVDEFAARLVDAVLANTGTCGETTGPLPIGAGQAWCTLPAGHAGQWHKADDGTTWVPFSAGRDDQGDAPTAPTLLDIADLASKAARAQQEVARAIRHQAHAEGEARGYQQAVNEMRGVVQRTGSPAARWAADYLEAVGPRTVERAFEAHADEALAIAEQALAAQAEVVHRCPPDTTGIMPCCGKPIMEAPKTDRITTEVERVTCSTRPDPEPAQTVPDGGDGAGVGERNDEEGTGGSGSHSGRRCPRCGQPITGFRSQPAMEDYSRGYVEVIAMATTYEPCGCTYTKDVRKPGHTDG